MNSLSKILLVGGGLVAAYYIFKNFSGKEEAISGAASFTPQESLTPSFSTQEAPLLQFPKSMAAPSQEQVIQPQLFRSSPKQIKVRVQDRTIFTTPEALRKSTNNTVSVKSYVKSAKRFSSVASIMKKTAGQHGGIKKVTSKFKGRSAAAQSAANR